MGVWRWVLDNRNLVPPIRGLLPEEGSDSADRYQMPRFARQQSTLASPGCEAVSDGRPSLCGSLATAHPISRSPSAGTAYMATARGCQALSCLEKAALFQRLF